MIILYTGKPGSGKSYKLVHDMLLKENQARYYMYHNIDGLDESVFDNPEMVKDWRSFHTDGFNEEEIFTEEFQAEISKQVQEKYGRQSLWIIDEAYRWFDYAKKERKSWLSYHRHYGQDIWLCSQDATQIHPHYRKMVEYEFRAKQGFMFHLPGYFLYEKRANGGRFGFTRAKKKKEIFDAYKSFEVASKRRFSWFIPATFILLGLVGVWWFRPPMESKEVEKKKQRPQVQGQVRRAMLAAAARSPKDETAMERLGLVKSMAQIRKKYSFDGLFDEYVILREIETGRYCYLHELMNAEVVKRGLNSIVVYNRALKRPFRIDHVNPPLDETDRRTGTFDREPAGKRDRSGSREIYARAGNREM